MGRLAARALFAKIRGDERDAEDVLVEPLLKIRDSVPDISQAD